MKQVTITFAGEQGAGKSILSRYIQHNLEMDDIEFTVNEDTIVLYPNLGTAIENITWTAANQFTGSNSNVVVGDLVEIIAGDNAGAISRITAISGTTYTIGTSLYASTAVSRARYLRFNDIGFVSNQAILSQRFITAARSPWIQFLIAFEGSKTSPQIERILCEYSQAKL